MLKCPECHYEHPRLARFCSACGSTLGSPNDGDHTMIVNESYSTMELPSVDSIMVGWLVPLAEPHLSIKILGRENVIGRSAESQINLLELLGDDSQQYISTVSRTHAQILKEKNGKIILCDLRSSNNTWINGQKLAPFERIEVPDNALIQFGKLEMLFKKFGM